MFESKFQTETKRSVDRFQRFQDSLRDTQARDADLTNNSVSTVEPQLFDQEEDDEKSFVPDNKSQPKPPQQ